MSHERRLTEETSSSIQGQVKHSREWIDAAYRTLLKEPQGTEVVLIMCELENARTSLVRAWALLEVERSTQAAINRITEPV